MNMDSEPVRFAFPTDEQRYAETLARELAETYRTNALSPDVGQLIIPDLTTDARPFRTVTIFNAVFSDHVRWDQRPMP